MRLRIFLGETVSPFGLGAPQEIAFGDHADDTTLSVNYRDTAEAMKHHQQRHLLDGRLSRGRDHGAGHDIGGSH
jgi:hypothetical protein